MRTDIRVDHFGTVAILTPLTVDAQWFGGTLAVEPRCVDAAADGPTDAGLGVDAV